MLTSNCMVDMGKKKLEMGIANQKISFDLFDEDKHLLSQNVCSEVNEVWKEMVLNVGTKFDLDP